MRMQILPLLDLNLKDGLESESVAILISLLEGYCLVRRKGGFFNKRKIQICIQARRGQQYQANLMQKSARQINTRLS